MKYQDYDLQGDQISALDHLDQLISDLPEGSEAKRLAKKAYDALNCVEISSDICEWSLIRKIALRAALASSMGTEPSVFAQAIGDYHQKNPLDLAALLAADRDQAYFEALAILRYEHLGMKFEPRFAISQAVTL